MGIALKEARSEARLTLRGLAARSGGRFKPSAVGGYERGERSVTVERFCELCRAYGAPPEGVLARALEIAEPARRVGVVLDLNRLSRLEDASGTRLRAMIERIRSERGDFEGGRVSLRAGDIETVAAAEGIPLHALLDRLEPTRAEDAPRPP